MIKIKSATQIEQMKKAGALSKMALRHVGAMVRPGVSTFELDQLAEQIIRMHGGTPAFKGYGGFPGAICASINDAVVHGIPNPDMILRDGDIISIDTEPLSTVGSAITLGRFSSAPPRPKPRLCARSRAIALRLPSSRLFPVTISGTSVMPFSPSPSLTVTVCFVIM